METSEPVLYLVICWAVAVSCIISIRAMAITVWNICLRPGSPHSRHSPSGAVTPREQIIGPPRESCPVCFTDFPLYWCSTFMNNHLWIFSRRSYILFLAIWLWQLDKLYSSFVWMMLLSAWLAYRWTYVAINSFRLVMLENKINVLI